MNRFRHVWRRAMIGTWLGVCILFASCGKPSAVSPNASENTSAAREVTDGAGRMVKLAGIPGRIVSLSPAATDILIAENAHAQITGATRYCIIPAADEKHVTRVGGVVDPDYERIVALKPGLVIVPWLADKTLQEKLVALGLPVMVLHPEGLQGVIDDIRMVGKASGHEAEGEAKAKAIESIRALAASRWRDVPMEKRPRVLIYMGDVCPAPGSYVDDLLAAAGGRNVLPRGSKAWVEVTPESALQLAPDITVRIFETGDPTSATGGPTSASTTREATLMDGAEFYHPGPGIGKALWALARAIDPARFPEVTPPETP